MAFKNSAHHTRKQLNTNNIFIYVGREREEERGTVSDFELGGIFFFFSRHVAEQAEGTKNLERVREGEIEVFETHFSGKQEFNSESDLPIYKYSRKGLGKSNFGAGFGKKQKNIKKRKIQWA